MVNYLIKNLLNTNLNIDELKNKLKYYKIYINEYENLLLLYRNYNSIISNKVERQCRSMIISKNDYKIIAYSCSVPIILNNINTIKIDNKTNITRCYEGTYITVFYYNNIWNISTRKSLNKGIQYNLFLDTINIMDLNKLDKDKIYNFILIHYKDKQIIDYTYLFGDNYKKLCLTCIRDKDMNELDLDLDLELSLFNNIIFLAEKIDLSNNDINDYEGIIIKKNNDLIKIQSEKYKLNFYNNINKYLGYIYLYQINKLDKDIKVNNYNMIGIISLLLKTLSNKIYLIYTYYYNINNGDKNELNNNNYNNLNKEYKLLLYKIRGYHFTNHTIDINNILNLLKNMNTIDLYNLIKINNNISNNNMISDFLQLL